MPSIDDRNTTNMMADINSKLDKIELDITSIRYQQVGMLACFMLLGVMCAKIAKGLPA